MGSKKPKRKKFKCQKLERFYKLKATKKKRKILLVSSKGTETDHYLQESNFTEDLESRKKSSRSCSEDEGSDVKHFAKVCVKIREGYFRYLQAVVSDNCAFCDALVTEEMLENLALNLEQDALLACLQIDIYKQSMLGIIRDIKRCTEEKQVHRDVRKLLPNTSKDQTDVIMPMESMTNSTDVETSNIVSTVASTKSDENEVNNKCFCKEQLNCNTDPNYSVPEKYQEECNEKQIDTQKDANCFSWDKNETFSSNFLSVSMSQTNENNTKNCQSVFASQVPNVQNEFSYLNPKNTTSDSYQSDKTQEEVDPLLKSRTQLQKSVEQTLNETEMACRRKQDEQERAHIAQILEGDDSFDERLNNSFSDNENESKENIDESDLVNRLEKMRELFGMGDEESQTESIPEKKQAIYKPKIVNNRNRRPTIWRYEKFIQLHKYSIIAAEMSYERRHINRRLFLELFGEDSDEEHEVEYSSAEKYRCSCVERISSWVVKYLMPFYQDKRILGRNVFKSLGHYISEAIVDKIQYPDEWTVKYFVSKFFPPKKKYVCDTDIFNFEVE